MEMRKNAHTVAKGLAREQKIDADPKGLDSLLGVLPHERSWMIFPAGVWTDQYV